MGIKSRTRTAAIYMAISGLVSLLVLFDQVTLENFRTHIYTALFSISLVVYYIISGVLCLIEKPRPFFILLLQIAFIFQAIQFNIFGLQYQAFCGPYLRVGFDLHPEVLIRIEAAIWEVKISNGYFKDSQTFWVMINFFPLIILWLLNKELKSNGKQAD